MSIDVCSFETAASNHVRDALGTTAAERWAWLSEAMAFRTAAARARATRGLVSLGPHGEILWSPMHEALWTSERRLPDSAECVAWFARRT